MESLERANILRNFPFYVYAIDSVIGYTSLLSAYSA